MSTPQEDPPGDAGHAAPAPPTFVPPGTAEPLPPDLGTRRQPVDCAIIGGGPAGLSAAIYLGRLRRSTLVFDDRAARSLWSQVNWNYLGFPNGIEAADLRKLGREQAARFGACFYNGEVAGVRREEDLFCVDVCPPPPSDEGAPDKIESDAEHAAALGEQPVPAPRPFYASTVIFATGVHDDFPDFIGRDACVGRTLFWCIICDGYDAVGKRVVVVGYDEEAASTALQLRQFTTTITLIAGQTGFTLPESRLADLHAAGIETFPCPIREFPNEDGCITALLLDDADGTRLPLDMVFAIYPKQPNSALAAQLGVSLSQRGYILASSEQITNVPGVFAAGDVTHLHNQQISTAVHEGGMAAAAANYYLYGTLQQEQHAAGHESHVESRE